MDFARYSGMAFLPTGRVLILGDNGRSIIVSAAQAEGLVNDRAVAGLPPIPIVDPPDGAGEEEKTMLPPALEPPVELPPSVLSEPLVLWARADASLTCERVIPYGDGFEIALRARGAALEAAAERPQRRNHRGLGRFAGLQPTVKFSDGRSQRIDDLTAQDHEGPVTISPFQRRTTGHDVLWLWVMPVPPEGPVQLKVTWVARGIAGARVELPGELLRGH